MTRLSDIEGIGEIYAAKLIAAGIQSQKQLLEQGARPQGRRRLATLTGISPALLRHWLKRADLARIKGIGEEYAELLEGAGVATVPALARRNAVNLLTAMSKVNAVKKLVRGLPTRGHVANWVKQAQRLDRALFY
jgi:predicted flap endonuclease-1-like 5' DNA nuclease